MRGLRAWVVLGLLAATSAVGAQSAADLAATLDRIGRRVEEYYVKARTLVCRETVILQPLARDLSSDGPSRRLVYELRVEWEPPAPGAAAGEAKVVRQLLTVNGRPPSPRDESNCSDPRPISPEPMAAFLASRRDEYTFKTAGSGQVQGRPALMLDFRTVASKPPDIRWNRAECVSVDAPSRTETRAWVDGATGEVLRIDERLIGQVDVAVPSGHEAHNHPLWMVIERADSSIEYRSVRFSDPDETILLPVSISSLTIVQNAGTPRLRVLQTFSDYRRFTTGGRVLN